jgi:hypothetical protein
MRLIDARPLKNKAFFIRVDGGILAVVTHKDIINAPTIEAEPVKHGKWIYREYDESDGSDEYYYCSECHEIALSEFGRYTFVRSDYCPNCGARMDGDPNG